MKKNILVLTPIYPAEDSVTGQTPVVHYFAKEWVKMGFNVLVINSHAVYSNLFYKLPNVVYKYVEKIFGSAVSKNVPRTNISYKVDGVLVNRICMKKYVPRIDFTNKAINRHIKEITYSLTREDFQPDYILGHWDSPCLLLVPFFRNNFPNSIISVVLHGMPYLSKNGGRNKYFENIKYLNFLGFRNLTDRDNYNRLSQDITVDTFLCHSGIPDEFIEEVSTKKINKRFNDKVWNLIFVGMLIDRKNPVVVLEALVKTKEYFPFTYTVIGEGILVDKINNIAINNNVADCVNLKGRIPRDQVMDYLINSQCFVMISKNEAYGLVYLEAMLAGCIVIASRNEGFDGIIIDGYNGFLCDAGNQTELEKIIVKIRSMPLKILVQISENAINTAKQYSDSKVAIKYLENIMAM